MQEAGETYDHYRTVVRQLADRCEFESITADQILRDKLVFGIQDSRVRERLLREKDLSLEKTDEICRAYETTMEQMKVVGGTSTGDTDLGRVVQRGADSRVKECVYCGRMHDVSKRENCPAFGKKCDKCNKQNHFSKVCFGSVPKPSQRSNRVHYLEDGFSENGSLDEVFGVEEISAVTLDDPQLLTLKLESGNYLRFQPDTGAQCNVVPLHLYKKATRDFNLINVTPVSTAIISYGGTWIPILGRVCLRVWRGDFRCFLDCNLMDSKKDETVKPVQRSPRRVPVAIRERLQETLGDLEKREIVARVTTPTTWISSMVVVPKPNDALRIRLDPKDLNRALQRENYPLPTIEEVASRLHRAKVFTVLDVACGFWHVALDEQSSFLTTFNTPFGRYRWKRMRFGIKSASEIFQRKMHELIEGLNEVEVIVDDFVVVGYGDSLEAASKDHDKSLLAFLQRCEERGIHLNSDKLKLRMREVPFIGHVAVKVFEQIQRKFEPYVKCPDRTMLQVYSKVTIQCDASQHGRGAVLLQSEQPVAYASRALTPTEENYAQIERELLAIVFACEKFDAYIYGRDSVRVQTDHKPLESIFQEELCVAPKRLQRMLLRLQKASSPNTSKRPQIARRTTKTTLYEEPVTELGRPVDVLVVKGPRLVVPTCMRKELMSVAHSTHIGTEGCLRRVRECLFWPRIASDVKDYVSKCDVCLAYRTSQTKEPLLQHEVIYRPRAKVAADLCESNGRTLLVVSDYFSNFIEVSRLYAITTLAVVRELKAIFARFGIPEIILTDNGPQFSSKEFKAFAESWYFNHITTSPRYPRSNGKAENAVKTVKRLFKKCKQSGVPEFQALLDWRNTPTEGMATIPAQRLMVRLCHKKRRQKEYYDRYAKPLPNLSPGEIVRMRLPGQKVWTPGTCLDSAGPRSFLIKAGGAVFRRNRRDIREFKQITTAGAATAIVVDEAWGGRSSASRSDLLKLPIIKTDETPAQSQTVVSKEIPLPSSSRTVSPRHRTVHVPSSPTSEVPSAEPPSFQLEVPPIGLQRSQRERKPPTRFRDYVLT
ncbi:Retrovirus-related Pol polyprotein from transposon 17.6 [Stylophora pistillata]|uniref:Retrovirus-related Pol polyprotein from transposon 17.6 n=1 Tax=Stylophora pistillata TaxID=50429 RepID=A0A2B4SLS0_STYPI|nr:Retrovirus-related Pol polyprotein from transposon 17.6 [Stylophora pistillata]